MSDMISETKSYRSLCQTWYPRQSHIEEIGDTNGVIRISKSKDRQHNGQKKKYKRTNNDLQNIHIKLKMEQHKPHYNGGELI